MPKRYHAAAYGPAPAAAPRDAREKYVRWATEKDSQFCFPGFEPNHRALRDKRDAVNAVKYYDPSAYGVVGPAAGAHGGGSPPPPPCGELAQRMRGESDQLAAALPLGGMEPMLNLNELAREGAPGGQRGGGGGAAPPPPTAASTRHSRTPSVASPAAAPAAPPVVYDKRAPPAPMKSPVAPPRRALTPKPRPHVAGKHDASHNKKDPKRLGRETPNSAFNRPFHAYGWKNTRPSVQDQYMKTYNAKARRGERYAHTTSRRSRSVGYHPSEEEHAAPQAPSSESTLPSALKQRPSADDAAESTLLLNASALSAAARSDAPTAVSLATSAIPAAAAPGGGAAADKTILINRTMQLTVRRTDSAKLLESSVRLALGVPAHLPLLLLDAQHRPVTLSYDALCNGEELSYDAARVAAHFAYVMDQTLANNRFYFLQRHVPCAGKKVDRGDRAADCFA
eukprot:TRINITY_DN18447_c0_g1_i1.p1 TRINITY_DN18447_c0_g1~~TRINITY_DN18447_c0_g1_i1.p1  ORF type:complete len:453 (+),score=173.39 TRINITY_DN18447_c0_g1_i1:73-1431(+)